MRHALRPYSTVVIAEDGMRAFSFDVNHALVRTYHHLGEDIGFGEAMRFRQELTKAIVELRQKNPPDKDSRGYTFLHGLTLPSVAAAMQAAVRHAGDEPEGGSGADATRGMEAVHSIVMRQVDEAQQRGDFVQAKSLLASVRGMMRTKLPMRPGDSPTARIEDPYIIQRLALITYKSEYPTAEAALKEARDLLVQAQRIRREVIQICRHWLAAENPAPEAKYWVQATMAEAHFGIGDDTEGQRLLDEALAMAPAGWMGASTQEQIAKLKSLLADSPLKHIKTDAARR